MKKRKILTVALFSIFLLTLMVHTKDANGEDPNKRYFLVECFDTGMEGHFICYDLADPFFFQECTSAQRQIAVPAIACPATANWSIHPETPIEQ